MTLNHHLHLWRVSKQGTSTHRTEADHSLVLTVKIPFMPTRLRLNEATISVNDEDRPGMSSLK